MYSKLYGLQASGSGYWRTVVNMGMNMKGPYNMNVFSSWAIVSA